MNKQPDRNRQLEEQYKVHTGHSDNSKGTAFRG